MWNKQSTPNCCSVYAVTEILGIASCLTHFAEKTKKERKAQSATKFDWFLFFSFLFCRKKLKIRLISELLDILVQLTNRDMFPNRSNHTQPKKKKKRKEKKKREGDAKSRKEKKKTPFSPGRTGWGRRGEERRIRVGCPPQIRSIGPLRRTPRPPHGAVGVPYNGTRELEKGGRGDWSPHTWGPYIVR